MSLDGFYAALAALVSDPDLVRQVRAGDHRCLPVDATPLEVERLVAMAADPRMSVLCSLYRSNRLTALVRTVPGVVDDLGDRLGATVSRFWVAHPRTDLQFRSEGEAFCAFVREACADDADLLASVDRAEVELAARYA